MTDGVSAEVYSGIIITLEATEYSHQCSGGKRNFAVNMMPD